LSEETIRSDEGASKERNGEKRDQLGAMCSIVAVALVVFMLLFIPTGPLKKFKRAQAEVGTLEQERELLRLSIKAEEVRLRSQDVLRERLAKRGAAFDLWPFLRTALEKAKLLEGANMERVTPRTREKELAQYATMVELRLPRVTLEQLVSLLHQVYSSDNLVVLYKLDYLRPASDNKGLECSATFLSPNA